MKIPYLAYRRFCAGLIAFILFAGVLTGCGGSAESSLVKREIPAPDEVSEEPQEAETAQTPALDRRRKNRSPVRKSRRETKNIKPPPV
ncbi:hypothetical protein SDC9_68740 [bioreactor metagenome]|uniref:Uncharacterized protein n=1 Tax=bioreactor metagenome TaxID=1076179 RepID=A0A644Y1R1_9ZZZZ